MHLYRRKRASDILDVALFIQDQVETSGQMHGYRWLHRKCLHKGFVVKQETVRILLQILDPMGVEVRRRRRLRCRRHRNPGPNYMWHVDGYEKLSPYGICINGCIDGYSRHITRAIKNTENCHTSLVIIILIIYFNFAFSCCCCCSVDIPMLLCW